MPCCPLGKAGAGSASSLVQLMPCFSLWQGKRRIGFIAGPALALLLLVAGHRQGRLHRWPSSSSATAFGKAGAGSASSLVQLLSCCLFWQGRRRVGFVAGPTSGLLPLWQSGSRVGIIAGPAFLCYPFWQGMSRIGFIAGPVHALLLPLEREEQGRLHRWSSLFLLSLLW